MNKERIEEKSFILETLNAVTEKNVRNSILIVYLKEQIAAILEIPKSEIDVDNSLIEMNIDSVTAVEIITQIEMDLNIKMELSELFESMTISKLSTMLNYKLMAQK